MLKRNMPTLVCTSKLIGEHHTTWPQLLGPEGLVYNSTVHTATGFCPHELFYSFAPSCPLDAVEAEREEPVDNADSYALRATERLHEAFRFVREFTGKQTERMKSNYIHKAERFQGR